MPFAFGLIRANVTRGGDLRYIWVALAALGGAAAFMRIDPQYRDGPSAAAWRSAGVFLSATASAAVAASVLGTMMGAGMLVVASAYGLCLAGASVLYLLGRE